MKTRATGLTRKILIEHVDYDPETGIFTRKKAAGGLKVGDVAGWVQKGYVTLTVAGFRVQAHRAAWLYLHGIWPTGDIDHIDGNPGNNRIANLRDVSKRVNMQNRRRPTIKNSSGYLGVSWCKQRRKWAAHIEVEKRTVALGRFDDPKEAFAAYVAAKRMYHEGGTL